MRLKEGQAFAGYTVVRKLGRGGMASVYLATEAGFSRQVALKILPEDLAEEPSFVARFQQEAQTIASLEHPSIVPLYRFGIEDGVPWMALRYVAGGDLARRLASRPLGAAEGFALLGDVARALDHAHRRGVIHRDLKPQNILLDEDGHAYLADFGVAKLLASTALVKTGTGSTVGTPAYMSPEQALGHELTPASDLYALGVICFQWWTGTLPFDADTPHAVLLKHALEPLPTQPLESMTPAMRAVLVRAMEKSPQARYPTATALVDALRDAQSMSAAATPPPLQEAVLPLPWEEAATTPSPPANRTPLTPPPPLPPQPAMTITPPPRSGAVRAPSRTPALVWWLAGGAMLASALVVLGLVGLWWWGRDPAEGGRIAASRSESTPAAAIAGEYEGFVGGQPLRVSLSGDGRGLARSEGEDDTVLAWHEEADGRVVVQGHASDAPIPLDGTALRSGRYITPLGLENGPLLIRRSGQGGASWPQVALLPARWAGQRIAIACADGGAGWLRLREDGRAKVRLGDATHDVAWVADVDGRGRVEVRLSGDVWGATLADDRWAASNDLAEGRCVAGALAVEGAG